MNSAIKLFTDFVFAETEMFRCDAIFIPGSHQPQLAVRAAELFHDGLAPVIIPSGGANNKLPQNNTEGEWLKDLLIAQNVPESAIYVETKARNTFDNADFTLKLIRENRLNIHSAIIVAKGFHSRRCQLTYQTAFDEGFRFCISCVADSNGNTSDNWYTTASGITTVMGEIRKIGEYFAVEIPGFRKKTGG